MKINLVAFLILCFSYSSFSQKKDKVLELINTVNVNNKDFYFEIPFEYRNGHIIIKVMIGDDTYDYLFDTGGYNDITDDIQRKNNFPIIATQTVGSSNRSKARVNIVRVDSLKIGELVFSNIAALQMNFDKTPTISCFINGALIGAGIIKNYIWQIDFSRKKIIVSDQLYKIPFINHAVKVPVTFNKRLMPFIEATVDRKEEKLLFDLGSSNFFSLTEKTALKYAANKNVIAVQGAGTEGGNGIVRQLVNVFSADSVKISSITFKNKPVVYTPLSNVDLIGNPVIKDFIITLNFKDNELYFNPIIGATVIQGWQSFGFAAEYKNGKILITTLYKGLSADKAGLQINDEIAWINGSKPDCKNYCDCMLLLSKILEKDRTLKLGISIGQSIKEVILNKEQVF